MVIRREQPNFMVQSFDRPKTLHEHKFLGFDATQVRPFSRLVE